MLPWQQKAGILIHNASASVQAEVTIVDEAQNHLLFLLVAQMSIHMYLLMQAHRQFNLQAQVLVHPPVLQVPHLRHNLQVK